MNKGSWNGGSNGLSFNGIVFQFIWRANLK